jgi:hypothetical protein
MVRGSPARRLLAGRDRPEFEYYFMKRKKKKPVLKTPAPIEKDAGHGFSKNIFWVGNPP